METDEMELDTIGDRKTALFVIISDTDDTFNFVVSILYPKYKYLSDADPKNAFDMEKHLKRRPAIVKPDEVFDYYELDAADLQEDADHEET